MKLVKLNILLCLTFFVGILKAENHAVPLVPKKMIFAGIELSISNSARADIQASVNRLHKNPKFFQNYVDQANLYFPVIEREFTKNGVPADIKYLCIQESGFKADAVSSSNAVGFWQFKELTALEQGLTVDRHVDDRKNIVSSSYGASKYLKSHNTRFGENWVFAIIAYNTGFGGAQKYFNQKYAGATRMNITNKTHWYFLKFLAHKIAFQGFVQVDAPKTILKIYEKTSGKTLKDYASQHGIPVEEVEKYNRWIKPNHKIPYGKIYPVVIPLAYDAVPIEDTEKPLVITDRNEDGIEHNRHEKKPDRALRIPNSHQKGAVAKDVKQSSGKNLRYKVNGVPAITAIYGDDSDKLAIKGGIVRSKFLKYNEIKSFEGLIPGQTYYLKKKKLKGKVKYHVVQHGEDLWSISQKYGMKKDAIRRKNRMSKVESLEPGRVLYLKSIRPEYEEVQYKKVKNPLQKAEQKTQEPEKEKEKIKIESLLDEKIEESPLLPDSSRATIHYIQKNETLYSISRIYKVTVDDIKECNGLTSDLLPAVMKYLKICDKNTTVEVVSRADTPSSTSTHVVTEIVDSSSVKEIEEVKIKKEVLYEEVKKGETKKLIRDTVVKKLENKEFTPTVAQNEISSKPDSVHYIDVLLEPGTTLYGLSKKYGVSTKDILEVNNLTDLQAGDTIKIPTTAGKLKEYKDQREEELQKENEIKFYTVKKGDTMYSLSKKLVMTVDDLKKLNGKTSNALSVGEVLKYK